MITKGSYVKDLKRGSVHKVEIDETGDWCFNGMVKIFSEDMSHSYWVNMNDYELAVLENIEVKCIVKK